MIEHMSAIPSMPDGAPKPAPTEAVKAPTAPSAPKAPDAAQIAENAALVNIIIPDLTANPPRLDAALADAARVDQSVVPPALDSPQPETSLIAEPLAEVEPQRPETIADDPRYKGLVQDLSLNYIKSNDAEWFNDRFPDPSVDENGYLTDKNGQKWLPSQNIGGRFAEMEAKARDRFAELYPEDAKAYAAKITEGSAPLTTEIPEVITTAPERPEAEASELTILPEGTNGDTALGEERGEAVDEEMIAEIIAATEKAKEEPPLFSLIAPAKANLDELTTGKASDERIYKAQIALENAMNNEAGLFISAAVVQSKDSVNNGRETPQALAEAGQALKDLIAKRDKTYEGIFTRAKTRAKNTQKGYSDVLRSMAEGAKEIRNEAKTEYGKLRESGADPASLENARLKYEAARLHYATINKEKRKRILLDFLKIALISSVITTANQSGKTVKESTLDSFSPRR